MAELLKGLARLLGIINYAKSTIEDSVRSTILEVFRNVGGDALLKVIYSFPEPVNRVEDELASLRLGDLEKICGGRVDVDCLLRILGVEKGGAREEAGADTRSREQA